MTRFPPEIELAVPGDFALVKAQAKIDKFADSHRTLGDDRADDFFFAEAGADIERVAHVQLKRILLARHAGDPALRPGRVRVCAFAFCNDSYRAMLRHLQGKAQSSDAAADHDEIVFLHGSRMLSIKRVLPKKTASASNEFGLTTSIGCKFSASTRST